MPTLAVHAARKQWTAQPKQTAQAGKGKSKPAGLGAQGALARASQSKRTARAASSGGLFTHPAMESLPPFLGWRTGSDQPVRLPDQYGKATAACVLKNEYVVNSDAAGICVFGEGYNLTGAGLTSVVTAGALGAITTTQHPQYASFAAEVKVARMCGIAIHVEYIGRTDDTAGTLSYDEKTTTAIGTTTVVSNEVSSVVQERSGKGITVYGTYTQEPRWEDVTVAGFMNNTYGVHWFFASGLTASKPTFRVRVWRFMEYLPADGAISEGSMMTEPYDPNALAVNSVLATPAVSIIEGTPDPGRMAKLLSSAYHIVQPVGRWMVQEAKNYLLNQSPLIAGAAAVGKLML